MRIPAPPPRARLRVLLLAAGLSLALVSGYLLLCTMGFSLPCPVYALTGLYCPGCGVTRMLLALLRLDFAAAWRCQPALLLALPPLALLLGDLARRYLRSGAVEPVRWHKKLLFGLIAALLLFGVVRNLPGFGFLRPPLFP